MRTRKLYQTLLIIIALATAMVIGAGQTCVAAVSPPDLTVCDNVTCENLPMNNICSAEGFKITLTNFQPANTSNGGTATYTYEIHDAAVRDREGRGQDDLPEKGLK